MSSSAQNVKAAVEAALKKNSAVKEAGIVEKGAFPLEKSQPIAAKKMSLKCDKCKRCDCMQYLAAKKPFQWPDGNAPAGCVDCLICEACKKLNAESGM